MTAPRVLSTILCLFVVGACASGGPSPTETGTSAAPTWTPPGAATGVSSDTLGRLLSRYWAWRLETSPLWATQLGVHRFDDRVGDNSKAALDAERSQMKTWLADAKAIEASTLEASDQTTLSLLIESLEANIGSEVCVFEEWNISPRGNPITEWNYLPQMHKGETIEDGKTLLARYKQIGPNIDNETAHLRRGAHKGMFANGASVSKVVEQGETQLAKPAAEWPLVKDVEGPDTLKGQLEHVVQTEIKPALARYIEFLKAEVLPNGRSAEKTGLGELPFGKACYAAQIRRHTTLTASAEDIHKVGLEQLAKINDEMRVLGQKLFGTKTLEKTLEKLRSDPKLYFETEAEVEAKAASALAAAKAAIPKFFGILPKADCIVRPIPDYEAPYTTIAYYRAPVPDGSKPGEYFVNSYKPKTRPRYEAAALAYHEAIPGHHLQIAIAQELPDMPAFRKHLGLNSYVEGWALYTERLSDEMGLYADDLDRMGMLSYQAWRASRLVVDTGIHAMGWSRKKAEDFMFARTALARNNIENEVDRYIVWPGQALGYMLGQLEILRLRRDAEATLQERFDIRGFHDAILSSGAVSLGVLDAQVKAWIAERSAPAQAE